LRFLVQFEEDFMYDVYEIRLRVLHRDLQALSRVEMEFLSLNLHLVGLHLIVVGHEEDGREVGVLLAGPLVGQEQVTHDHDIGSRCHRLPLF